MLKFQPFLFYWVGTFFANDAAFTTIVVEKIGKFMHLVLTSLAFVFRCQSLQWLLYKNCKSLQMDLVLTCLVFVSGVDLSRRRHRRSKSKTSTAPHKDCSELTDENMTVEIVRQGKTQINKNIFQKFKRLFALRT